MTDKQKQLLKQQLYEAQLFKDNVLFNWVKNLADEIIQDVKAALNGGNLVDKETNIQQICDIFAGRDEIIYKHQHYYKICLKQYDSDLEPFNHLRNVHNLMDKLKN